MVHDIPGAIHIEITEMITVIPFLDLSCIRRKPCVCKQTVHFVLGKSKVFIELRIGNGIGHEIIRPGENAFFGDPKTACDHRKFQ